jgi:cyclophilin family peptidyl-prolyl cis-trans isomerase
VESIPTFLLHIEFLKVFNPLTLLLISGLVSVFAADVPAVSNSVVRFHFATGDGPVGDVDVELFNAEKPETVRNFLLYARNGSYNQVLLHRLLPGVLLQGGGFTNVAAATNANPFLNFGAVRGLAAISNEFSPGTLFSNIPGTLAMARAGSDPNSATSQWFFNLGDNSGTLDAQNYVVFGRVLSGTNENSGTNLLATFNALSISNGIVDMRSFFGSIWSAFTNLPVNYTGHSAPQNRQLFYVTVTELDGPAADTNAPTVAIASPLQNEVVTNSTLTVTGTAADDRGVARVQYLFGDATPRLANGTTNWSATITLSLGANAITVQSMDEFGNVSAVAQRTVHYQLPTPPVPNSLVRFHFATGEGPVGDVDVELFNSQKPETVRNFLLYVRNGSYSNVLLNRLVPGVLLQGGGFTNHAAPTNANAFLTFGTVRNLGTIPGEFNVGTLLSNVMGTLAMARATTNANSASSQWFFNLGDNSGAFDSDPGGFTVFGRVLPATNGNAGTNLLATFNSLSLSNGIVNMASFFGATWNAFTNLPVNYTGHAVPQSRQLFYVTVSELNGPIDDTISPSILVTSPAQDAVVTNASLTLTGTASDSRGVARVLYFFGDATTRVASGTTNWTATVTLSLGTNVITLQSVDTSGNLSPLVTRIIRYELPGQTVSNSVVRFHFFTGEREVGGMDVELFDADKPQTVRNFLLYVRNGSYNNVLLHRLAENFVLQGGGYTNVSSPTSSEPFTVYSDVPNLGVVTNEFSVGRRMSNWFGTIAMAKLPNQPHSASSEWFFNLANNSTNLDSQNGGFTVFGRVIPSTNLMAGTNVLNFFTSLTKSNGIVDMTSFYGSTWSALNELPVDHTNWAIPRNNELFYVTVTEPNAPAVDVTPPSVTITNPAPDAIVTNATVTLSGTASDDQQVARVIYYFNDTLPRVAFGTTNWSATLSVRSGTNYVFVQAVDRFGNFSPVEERQIVFSVRSSLTLEITGNGFVTGVTNGEELEVGQTYTIAATAGKGSYFNGWSGTVSASSEELTFRMQTNMTLKASFKLFPLPKGQGTYKGLFIATNQPSLDSSGVFSTSVRSRGHSGRIQYRGGNYVFDGRFDNVGQTTLQGSLLGQNVSMTLRLDITEAPRRLAGVAFIGGTVAALESYRVERRARTNELALPGNYTFLISGAPNAATAPGGQGFGTMKMGRSGRIKVTGTLGEGTTFKHNGQLLGQDRWPIHLNLYKKEGAILGWSRFDTNASSSFAGPLYWFKPGSLTNTYYPSGFTSTVQFRGAPFHVLPQEQRVLNWTNGTVILAGGNLQRPLTFRVMLDEADNLVMLTGPTSLTMSIDRTSGRVAGSFFHPVTQTHISLEGIVVQGLDEGGGLFYGPDQTGSFSILKQ